MYLDFDDHRPDVPRVSRAWSGRAGAGLSLAFHAGLVLMILFAPSWVAGPVNAVVPVVPSQDAIRFVSIVPRIEKSAIPPRPADHSDRDRRSVTRLPAPQPKNPDPVSLGNSPEKIEGTNGERAILPEPPAATPPPAEASATAATKPASEGIAIETAAPPPVTTPGLATSVRNLQRYFQTQNFDNPDGGQTGQGADIQFDSRGVDFGPWLRRFKAQVERNWYIPLAAQINRGRVVVQFFVHRDGRISELRVVQPAGTASFNTAAFNAIRMSNPTQPLPPEYPVDQVLFTVTFHYNDR